MEKPLCECRVLVTPTSFSRNDPELKGLLEARVDEVKYNTTNQPLTAKQLIPIIPNFDGYIAGLDEITQEVIEVAENLKVIARYGVGVDMVDLEAAKSKGIIVTNTPGANSSSVAELAVGLMLALARNIPEADRATRAGEWPRYQGTLLEGKTVGLFGFGAIGKRVAQILSGFNCNVIAYDPYPDIETARKLKVEIVEQDDIIHRSDFLSLHCPALPDTRQIVNKDFLEQMKSGTFLINTSRGELINDDALCESLKKEHLRGAALDVFTKQPPDPEDPLLALPQVIVTPHSGSHTDGAINSMGWSSLKDCLAVLRGEEPAHRIV